MPTVLAERPYSFVFFSSDQGEPIHIHVKRDLLVAKFWLTPISMARNQGFPEHELNRIERLVIADQERFVEAWYDHFGA